MASEKQIAANRINGLNGGVKTEQGKLAVRLNAVSHGIFSKDVLLPGEDAALLRELETRIIAEYQPVGEMETILVERIISSTWRLKRVIRGEMKYTRYIPEEVTCKNDYIAGADYRYQSWQNVVRYETLIERQIYRAVHELERLQSVRLGRQKTVPVVEVSETPALTGEIEDGKNKKY